MAEVSVFADVMGSRERTHYLYISYWLSEITPLGGTWEVKVEAEPDPEPF